MVSWVDASESGDSGGAREKGRGSYLLYNALTGQVVVRGRLERPNNGHVADNGTFVLEDWRFGDGPVGTLCVFDVQGKSLFIGRSCLISWGGFLE